MLGYEIEMCNNNETEFLAFCEVQSEDRNVAFVDSATSW